jgi:hypothetical protein
VQNFRDIKCQGNSKHATFKAQLELLFPEKTNSASLLEQTSSPRTRINDQLR